MRTLFATLLLVSSCKADPATDPSAQIDVRPIASSLPLAVSSEPLRTAIPVNSHEPLQFLRCSEEGSIRSAPSEDAVDLKFVDDVDGVVEVFWLDFDGRRVPYNAIVVNSSYVQHTYITHPWILIRDGQCMGIVVPNLRGEHRVVLSKLRP